MGANNKVSRVQVSNWVLTHDNVTHNGFGLYVILKSLSFDRDGKRRASFYLNELKSITGWKDNRTLRRHFDNLEELGLISGVPARFSVGKRITINVNDKAMKKGFVQVDKESIDKIIGLTRSVKLVNRARATNVFGMALRLFYYYEKNYNTLYGVAFPGYRKIREDIGVSYESIKSLNDFFDENRIVLVVESFNETVEDDYGIEQNKKRSNAYIPMCKRKMSV